MTARRSQTPPTAKVEAGPQDEGEAVPAVDRVLTGHVLGVQLTLRATIAALEGILPGIAGEIHERVAREIESLSFHRSRARRSTLQQAAIMKRGAAISLNRIVPR